MGVSGQFCHFDILVQFFVFILDFRAVLISWILNREL